MNRYILWSVAVTVSAPWLIGCSTDTTIGKGAGGGDGGAAGSTGAALDVACLPLDPLSTGVTTLPTCPSAQTAYEFSTVQDFEASTSPQGGWWAWGEPGSTFSVTLESLEQDPCGHRKAIVMKSAGELQYGSGFGPGGNGDERGWDGIAIRARSGLDRPVAFQFQVQDGNIGKVIDSTTGEKTCYGAGDDWDLDGQPNSAPPPANLLCSLWSVWLDVGVDWSVTLIPWSALEQPNPTLAAMGMDFSRIADQLIQVAPCDHFELWLDEIDLYRAAP